MDIIEFVSNFLVIGSFVCLLVGIVDPLLRKGRCSETVSAVVVANKRHRQQKHYNRYWYKPIYEYTYNGEVYRVLSKNESSTAPYEIGSEIMLNINPNKPKQFFGKGELSIIKIVILVCFTFFSMEFWVISKIFF